LGLGDSVKMIAALERAAATADGDDFPLLGQRFIGVSSGPRIEAVLHRYKLEPKRFVKGSGAR
jgi:hypothetical protein